MQTDMLMEAAAHNAGSLPVTSPNIIVGPREYVGGRVMHFAKLKGRTRYFRMGEKEVFLLAQLNGAHSYEEITEAYASRFGKRLSHASWLKALQLFESRELFDTPRPVASRELAGQSHMDLREASQSGAAMMSAAPPGLFSHKLIHWNPDRMLDSMTPGLRWLVNGPAIAIWSVLLLAVELFTLLHLHAFWSVASSLSTKSGSVSGSESAWRAVCFIAIVLVMTALHESGHAISCKRYGGEVREVGVLVRYFVVCAYARIDDILLLQRRSERLYVLLMGSLVGLTAVPFALLLWYGTPASSLGHYVAADLLIWYNIGCLFQLLPFLKLDGYYMLAQVLKMPELRTDSYAYLTSYGQEWFKRGKRQTISPECAGYVQPVYIVYGLSSAIVSIAFIGFMLLRYSVSLRHLLGPVATLVLGALMTAGILWRIYTAWFLQWKLTVKQP